MTERFKARLTRDTVEVGSLAVLQFVLRDEAAARTFDDWKSVREEVRAVVERHLVSEEANRRDH